MADGFTGGDPNKLDVAGGTMTGELVLDDGSPAASQDYVAENAGGAGGVPSTRTITATGPYLSGGGDLSTNRSIGAVVGTTSGTLAAGDDSRLSNSRTPTLHAASHATDGSDEITPASIGAATSGAPAAAAGAALASAQDYADDVAAAAQAAAVASAEAYTDAAVEAVRIPSADTGYLTGGGAISIGVGPTLTAVGPTLTIAAEIGDRLWITPNFLVPDGAGFLYFNVATRVAGVDTNWFGDGSSSFTFPSGSIRSWFVWDQQAGPIGAPVDYVVQANDLVAGQVTVQVYGGTEGDPRTVNRSTSWPFRLTLENRRQGAA